MSIKELLDKLEISSISSRKIILDSLNSKIIFFTQDESCRIINIAHKTPTTTPILNDYYKIITTMIETYSWISPNLTKLILCRTDCEFAKSMFDMYKKKNIKITLSQLL